MKHLLKKVSTRTQVELAVLLGYSVYLILMINLIKALH